jgi:hypothetical protein
MPEADDIVVPARASDGRVVFVSIPRRAFLQVLSAATIGMTAPGAFAQLPATPPTIDDVNPVEHFRQLRRVLVENDRLFGPRQVISVVRETDRHHATASLDPARQ